MLVHVLVVINPEVCKQVLDLVTLAPHIPITQHWLGNLLLLSSLGQLCLKDFADSIVVGVNAEVSSNCHRSLCYLFRSQLLVVNHTTRSRRSIQAA